MPPPASYADSGLKRNKSGDVATMMLHSPNARVPPRRTQSMSPNAAARNGKQPQRPLLSEQMQSPTAQPIGTNRRPSSSQRAPSLPLQRTGNTNGLPPSTPTRDHANPHSQSSSTPNRQVGLPTRVPSARRPETGNNNSGPSMVIPSTPKRDQEMRTVPHTPSNSTPKRPMPPQQHPPSGPRGPQRTISLPDKNVPPNRSMTGTPTKEKIDASFSTPTRANSMPIKSTQHPSNDNQTSTAKQLSQIT